MTAWAAPSKLAGRSRAIATWRARASASMLSDIERVCSTSRARSGLHGGQRLGAGRGLAEDDGGAGRAEGVGECGPGVEAGLPAARDRAGADPCAVDGGGGDRGGVAGGGVGGAPAAGGQGAVNSELSTTTRVTGVPAGMAATTWVARSATVGAPG